MRPLFPELQKEFSKWQKTKRSTGNIWKKSLRLASYVSLLGIFFGFILAEAGIIGGFCIAYLNPASTANVLASGAVSGISLLGLIRTFVIGTKNQNEKQDRD